MLAIEGYKGHLAHMASRAVNSIYPITALYFLPVNQSIFVRLLRLLIHSVV